MYIYKESFFYNKLECTYDELQEIINNKADYYNEVQIPKKDGYRKLQCLVKDSPLYNIQRKLTNRVLNHIPIAGNVYGFVKGSSYFDFLRPHINLNRSTENKYYLRLDIKDFFGACSDKLINQVFDYYFKIDSLDTKEKLIKQFVEVVTVDKKLPQGAITSPAISNILFRQYDIRIYEYCSRFNITYSRYADDLLFSSNNDKLHESFFISMIHNIINSCFKLNASKVKKTINEISLNGFVVGKNIRISRKRLQDLSKIKYLFFRGGRPENIKQYLERLNLPEENPKYLYRKVEERIDSKDIYFSAKSSLIHYLCGYRAFMIGWLPEKRNKNYDDIKAQIDNLQKFIDLVIYLD